MYLMYKSPILRQEVPSEDIFTHHWDAGEIFWSLQQCINNLNSNI